MPPKNDQSTGVSTIRRWLASATWPLIVMAATRLFAAETNTVESDRSTVPVFQVRRYEVVGSSALSQDEVNRIMSDAIGNSVSIQQLRRSLTKVQQSLRNRGYTHATVTLPRQPLTNGIVVLKVFEGPETSSTTSAELRAMAVPAYNVRHFEVYGNTTLTPEEIDRILGPAAGPSAGVADLHQALAQLREAYRDKGFSDATVTVPQQILTDGTVVVRIDEGASLVTNVTPTVAAVPPPKPARTFEVLRYEVLGNSLLSQEKLETIFTPATGTNVTFQKIQKALGDLQLAYRERGFASASVSLPQQQITNATVKVQVVEGRLVDVRVTGNRYFSSNNIVRALPSLQEALIWKDQVVNSRVLQREVDLANQNRDRQIYPVINPGPDPGTSALELRVKDRIPLHGRIEVNNQSTPGTPEWRINSTANYANLWQLEHSFGLFYGFTPEEFKEGGLVEDRFFNRPLIANYGAYYRIPIGTVESVQGRINDSANFGYNEATHEFRLPPAGGRPDLTFSVSGSSSDTGVNFGPAVLVSQTPLLTIVSQDSGQEITLNQGARALLNVPHALSDTRRFNFFGGLDWKHNERTSYNTNNFTITTVVTNSQGSQTIESQVASPQPVRHSELTYLPLNLGFDFSQTDKRGTFSARLGLGGNFVGDSSDFVRFSYTTKAQAQFGKVTLALTRDQKVFGNWSLLLRASGQAATGPLTSDEAFTIGGINSVRGYLEADERGDEGWFGSVELRTPFIATRVPSWSAFVPAWVRGSVFVDAGQRYLIEQVGSFDQSRFLMGAGFGLSANINNHFAMRIAVGWPLQDSINTRAGDARAYFSFGGQF